MFAKLEVSIKRDVEWDSRDGLTESATETPLFTHHVVKEEMDLGTEPLQLPNAFTLQVSVKKEEEAYAEEPSIDLKISPENPGNSSSNITDNLIAECIFKCNKCGKDFIKSDLENKLSNNSATFKRKSSKDTIFCTECSAFTESSPVHPKANIDELSIWKNNSGKKTLRPLKTTDKPFKCSQCSSAFTHSKSLRRHEGTHIEGKTYKCSQCSAAFIQSSSLRDHLRTHTGEKPYKCYQCESAFAQSSTLNAHIKTHSSEKPFKCSQCNSAFTTDRSLKVHFRTHTGEKPFKCNLCSSRFTQSGFLQAHLRTHTGEKPFKCNVCDYRATQSSHLKLHIMSRHSGQKPYGCDACGYRGATKNHLRQHLKKFH